MRKPVRHRLDPVLSPGMDIVHPWRQLRQQVIHLLEPLLGQAGKGRRAKGRISGLYRTSRRFAPCAHGTDFEGWGLLQLALMQWREYMFNQLVLKNNKLVKAVLQQIENHRNGEEVDTTLLKGVIESIGECTGRPIKSRKLIVTLPCHSYARHPRRQWPTKSKPRPLPRQVPSTLPGSNRRILQEGIAGVPCRKLDQ